MKRILGVSLVTLFAVLFMAQIDNPTTLALTTVTTAITQDVTMTNAGQWYDGPAVSLTAGKWLVTGTVTLISPGGGRDATCKLWDGTNVGASTEWLIGANASHSYALSAIVSPTGAATWKISCASVTNGGETMKAAAPNNAAGNTASVLSAVKVQ